MVSSFLQLRRNASWLALYFLPLVFLGCKEPPASSTQNIQSPQSDQPLTESAAWIVKNGEPQAEIVISANPPRTVSLAAQELQTYLQKISGAQIPITTEASGKLNTIYVGSSAFTEKLGLETTDLKNGAFRMASGSNWLALLGNDQDYQPKEPWSRSAEEKQKTLQEWDAITGEHFDNIFTSVYRKVDQKNTGLWEFDLDNSGTFNAVNEFLRSLGVRWYLPGELGEVVPEKKDITLPQVNKTVKPDFALRNLYQFGGNFWGGKMDEILWQLRLGTNQGMGLLAFGPNVAVSHGIKNVVSREENKAAHPEMYREIGGRRQTTEGIPCLSSEELVQANVRYLRKFFDTYDVPMASVMPTDGFSHICQCEKCQGKETPDRGRLGSLSDYVWSYVVKVAEELAKTHPDKKIHCLAYTTYLLPPEKIDKLPPNVVVGIAQNRSNFHNPEWRDMFYRIRKEWEAKNTSGVPFYQYEYYLQDHPTRQWAGLPVLYPRLIVEDLRSLKGHSLGDYAEVNRSGINPINLFNAYVTARFYWDVNQDLEALENEYFQLFYGPAEQPMREFYRLSEANWRDFSAEDIETLWKYLDQASQLAGDSIYGKRVQLVREKCDTGLKTAYIRKKEPELKTLGYLDTTGIEPTANADSLLQTPLVDIQSGNPIAENPTQVSLGWTGSGLFVRVVCHEADMSSIRALAEEKDDTAMFRDDAVEIVVSPPDKKAYYHFVINSNGVVTDIDQDIPNLGGLKWESAIEVQVFQQKNQWIVECVIPANQIGATQPTRDQPWLINVGRIRERDNRRELTSLHPSGGRGIGIREKMLKFYFPEKE